MASSDGLSYNVAAERALKLNLCLLGGQTDAGIDMRGELWGVFSLHISTALHLSDSQSECNWQVVRYYDSNETQAQRS